MMRVWQRKPLKDIEQYLFYLEGAVHHTDEELTSHKRPKRMLLHWRVVKDLVTDNR